MFERSQIHNLIKNINYQEGSIISKTLIDKKSGTVTFFAFDKGQGLSKHTAPYDALVHVLEGALEITISGKSFKLKKDDVIIMPANEPHALFAIEQMKMILTLIHS